MAFFQVFGIMAMSALISMGLIWGIAAIADLGKPSCGDGRVAVFVARDGWFCVVGEAAPLQRQSARARRWSLFPGGLD